MSRNAKAENMAQIVSKISKEIPDDKYVSIRELTKKAGVSSSSYLENILQSIMAYHLACVEKIMKSYGKEKALSYAEAQIVPRVDLCGNVSMVKNSPLIIIMRENAARGSAESDKYFGDMDFESESEENPQPLQEEYKENHVTLHA